MLTNRCLVDVLLPLTLKLVRKPFCILHNVTTMSGSSQSPIVLDDEEERSPVGRSFSRIQEDKFNFASSSLDDSGGHFEIHVEDLEEEMSANQQVSSSSNNSSGFLSRFRQRPQQRNQDQLAYAAAVAEAERLNANRRRRNIAELRGATEATSAGIMAQIMKTSTDQLELQRRTNTLLQDLSTSLAALTRNQTDLHRSMALQEERLRQVETMTISLATKVQEIQVHLASALPLPPSYEEIEGEVLL